MRKRNGPSPETRSIYGPLTARVPMPRVQFYRKGERPASLRTTTSAYPLPQPTVEEPHENAPPEVEPFEGTKPFNLTLVVAPENSRDKFSALEHKHTYREIRPNRAPGQRGAYQVEMTYPEYQRALEDARDSDVNLIAVEPEVILRPHAIPGAAVETFMDMTCRGDLGLDGKGIDVGIVEFGYGAILSNYFAGRVKAKRGFGGSDPDSTASGQPEHGAAMASIAVPPAARIVAASYTGTDSTLVAALYWMVDEIGVHVINLSQGSFTGSTIKQDVTTHIAEKNVPFFVSRGNEGTNQLEYPAAYPGALAISNYVPSTGEIQPDSSFGGLFAAAAGEEIYAIQSNGTTETYVTVGGTSYAAASATRTAALALSGGVSFGNLLTTLRKGAMQTGAGSTYEGAGVLHLCNSVSLNTPPAPPDGSGSAVGPGSTSDTDSGAGGSGDLGSIDFLPGPGGPGDPIGPGDPGSPEAECGVDPNNDTPEANETRAYVLQTQDPDQEVADAGINWLLEEYFNIYHSTPEEDNPELWAHILATCNTGYFCADIHTVPIRFIVECEFSYSNIYAPPESPIPLPGPRNFYMEHVLNIENLVAGAPLGTDTVYNSSNLYFGASPVAVIRSNPDIPLGCVYSSQYKYRSLGRINIELTAVDLVWVPETFYIDYYYTTRPNSYGYGIWNRNYVVGGKWHIRFMGRTTHRYDAWRRFAWDLVPKDFGINPFRIVDPRVGVLLLEGKQRFNRYEDMPPIDPEDPDQIATDWSQDHFSPPHYYFNSVTESVSLLQNDIPIFDEMISEVGIPPGVYDQWGYYPDQAPATTLYWDTPNRAVYVPLDYKPGLRPQVGPWTYENGPQYVGYSLIARDLNTRWKFNQRCGEHIEDQVWYNVHQGGVPGHTFRDTIEDYGRTLHSPLTPFNWTNQLVTTTTVKITGVYVGPWPPPGDGGDLPQLNPGLDLDNPPTMDMPMPDLDLPCVDIPDVGIGMCMEDMTMPEMPMPCFPDFPFGDCPPSPGTGSGIGDFGPSGEIPDDGMGNGIGTGITAGKDTFAEDKCFPAGTRLDEAINELSDVLGLDADQMTIEGTCEDTLENEKCFPKGSSIWDAVWWLSDQCGMLPIDGGDTVTIANPTPLSTTWILNEYTNLFDFTPVLDNSELFWGVEVFRADITNGGTVITPGLDVMVQVPTVFSADPQEVFRVSVDPGVTEIEATRMAIGLARKMGRISFRITATTFFLPNVRLRHRIRIVRPSKDFDMEFMCTSISHDLSETGKFTTVEAQVILDDPVLVPA